MARTVPSEGARRAAAQQVEDRFERLHVTFDTLCSLIEKIGATFDVSEIARLFLAAVTEQLKVERISLFLVVPEKRRLEPYRSLGLGRADVLGPVDVDSSLVRWLREAAGPVHFNEFFAAMGETAGGDEEAMRRFVDAGFSDGIALVDQGTLLGVLIYGGTVTGEPFSHFDNELLSALTRVASITIRNAFLCQSALASKLELERFSEVKREFISHTSHELRTPLTVLKSTLWSLEPAGVGDGVLVDMARDAVERLQSKVDYLLSLNDIELNTTDFNFGLCEVSGLVEDVLRENIPELEEKQIRVSVDDRAIDRKAMVDPGKVKIVLRSILDNAVNSVGRGGTITVMIRVSPTAPGAEEGAEIGDWRACLNDAFVPGMIGNALEDKERAAEFLPARSAQGLGGSPYVVVTVKDDGIGIPSEEIKTLAEPFGMASNSTNRNVKGLGIGLSVSQKIVAGHGGKIFCKSDLGQGAQFSVWLPLSS